MMCRACGAGADPQPEQKRPKGVDLIHEGKCPIGMLGSMSCMMCGYGHMLECHYPMNCKEANCSHYRCEGDED